MKKIKLGTVLTIFAMALFIFSCGDSDHSHDENGEHSEETTQTDENSGETATAENGEVDKSGKEYTSAFICSMHCAGSGSHEAGKCSVCGMDYVANEDYKSNSEAAEEGQDDDDDHEGHDH